MNTINNKIKYKDKFDFKYDLESGYANSNERYFKLNLTNNNFSIDFFEEFLREIRVVLGKIINKEIEILNSDISLYFSKKIYPLIYKLENKMRGFITMSMIGNIGVRWGTQAFPEDLKEKINSKKLDRPNLLKKLDFSDLGVLLFKEYSTHNVQELFNKITFRTFVLSYNL